jgi:hypothetical protein
MSNAGSGKEELVYQGLLRMVLWGEPKEDILRKARVNGLSAEEAEGLYQKAIKERIRVIRAEYRGKALKGLMFIIASVTLFFIAAATTGRAFVIFALGVAYGLWKAIDGISGILMAANREGSVGDIE